MRYYTHYIIECLNPHHYRVILKSSKTVVLSKITYTDYGEQIRIRTFEASYTGEDVKAKYEWQEWDWEVLKPILFAWMHEAFSAITKRPSVS